MLVSSISTLKIVDDLVVQDCEKYGELMSHMPLLTSEKQRINIQNFMPNMSADDHILNLEVELY